MRSCAVVKLLLLLCAARSGLSNTGSKSCADKSDMSVSDGTSRKFRSCTAVRTSGACSKLGKFWKGMGSSTKVCCKSCSVKASQGSSSSSSNSWSSSGSKSSSSSSGSRSKCGSCSACLARDRNAMLKCYPYDSSGRLGPKDKTACAKYTYGTDCSGSGNSGRGLTSNSSSNSWSSSSSNSWSSSSGKYSRCGSCSECLHASKCYAYDSSRRLGPKDKKDCAKHGGTDCSGSGNSRSSGNSSSSSSSNSWISNSSLSRSGSGNGKSGQFLVAWRASGAAIGRARQSHAAVAADWNKDGAPDLFVANDGSANDLFWGDGKGGFRAQSGGAAVGAASKSCAAIAADWNKDGAPDLFLANFEQANQLFWGDGKGGFRAQSGGAGAPVAGAKNTSWTFDAVAADWNQDGAPDLFIVNYGSANELFWGDGKGGFRAHSGGVAIAGATESFGAVAADWNKDGYLDIFLANYDQANQLFWGDGKGGFRAQSGGAAVTGKGSSYAAITADWNKDGYLDVYVGNDKQANELFWGDGKGGFRAQSGGAAIAGKSSSYAVVAADWNQDGAPDLFVANDGQANELFLGDGKGGFRAQAGGALITGNTSSKAAVAADWNQDGAPDLFVANYGGTRYPRGKYNKGYQYNEANELYLGCPCCSPTASKYSSCSPTANPTASPTSNPTSLTSLTTLTTSTSPTASSGAVVWAALSVACVLVLVGMWLWLCRPKKPANDAALSSDRESKDVNPLGA